MVYWWPLLLPAAAWSGWWLAAKKYLFKDQQVTNRLTREYVVGLNYLLNEQPDKAVDIFIKLLEVDSETVETHLALGSLFRRRGEVDRAIRVHQNLIARPQLSFLQRKEALLALGQDYMSAGLFDRAERIFLEVVALKGDNEVSSLQGLLAIYQQEKAWEKALSTLQQLEIATGQNMQCQASHYYCEMALQSIKDENMDKALSLIKQALCINQLSVRASLIRAHIEMTEGKYKQAIRTLKRVPEQDPAFITETIEPLMECAEKQNAVDECIDFLLQTIDENPSTAVIFVIGDYLRREKSDELGIDFVTTQLSRNPSIRGINRLICWYLEASSGSVRDKLQMLYDITGNLLENKPIYRCGQCGYGGKLLHWHCPSCKQWGKMKPIHGLEGD